MSAEIPPKGQPGERNDFYMCAKLVRDVEGKFAKFKAGELVLVRDISGKGKHCSIERARWKGSLVRLSNVLSGVPMSAVDCDV